ncbi:hypothetical protein CAPTEDRAFT_201542 [Capitella teleta]|uniref:Uncharacterized protein n=1 Tax=Capitella teleta TaxID=283909 RepID=R7UG00_CAPTE|nr:hypothetical protein CAPTEDRAFT_201542 [Capitella teleta]|eukprot:ELU02728.1 hypothetical protein CAPTEDRAFT_201542 [Capitella teleta]
MGLRKLERRIKHRNKNSSNVKISYTNLMIGLIALSWGEQLLSKRTSDCFELHVVMGDRGNIQKLFVEPTTNRILSSACSISMEVSDVDKDNGCFALESFVQPIAAGKPIVLSKPVQCLGPPATQESNTSQQPDGDDVPVVRRKMPQRRSSLKHSVGLSSGRSVSFDMGDVVMMDSPRLAETMSPAAQHAALSCYEEMVDSRLGVLPPGTDETRVSGLSSQWRSRQRDARLTGRRLSMQINVGMTVLDRLKLSEKDEDNSEPNVHTVSFGRTEVSHETEKVIGIDEENKASSEI